MSEKRCEHCQHYICRTIFGVPVVPLCSLDRPLVPCEFFEREVGADDE